MTTQTTVHNTPETTTTPEQKRPKLGPVMSLVSHVARSEEFTSRKLDRKVPQPLAYAGAVGEILNDPNNGFNALDSQLLRVTSRLGTYIEAQQEIEDADYKRAKDLKLNHLIPFNHELKALIDVASDMPMRQLAQELSRAHGIVFANYNSLHPNLAKNPKDIMQPGDVAKRLEATLDGMRHEMAVETMLTAAGIKYDYIISAQEDARGIDIIIYLDGVRVPLDIKSTFLAEQRTQREHPNSNAVWTSLKWDDFTGMKGQTPGALGIPYEVAQDHAEGFVNRIYDSIEVSQGHRSGASHELAKTATRY